MGSADKTSASQPDVLRDVVVVRVGGEARASPWPQNLLSSPANVLVNGNIARTHALPRQVGAQARVHAAVNPGAVRVRAGHVVDLDARVVDPHPAHVVPLLEHHGGVALGAELAGGGEARGAADDRHPRARLGPGARIIADVVVVPTRRARPARGARELRDTRRRARRASGSAPSPSPSRAAASERRARQPTRVVRSSNDTRLSSPSGRPWTSPVLSSLPIASRRRVRAGHPTPRFHVVFRAERLAAPRARVVAAPSAPAAPRASSAGDASPSVDYFATDKRPVILFDGVCNLCNGGVNFALDMDPPGKLRFAALQSTAGRARCSVARADPDDKLHRPRRGGCRVRQIGRGAQIATYFSANPLFPFAGTLGPVVPGRSSGTPFYDAIADNRYELLGMKDEATGRRQVRRFTDLSSEGRPAGERAPSEPRLYNNT